MNSKFKKIINTGSENITALFVFILAYLLPLIISEYQINIYSYFMISILLSLSLTLIWGYTGIFSFAQATFFGIGGYAYGVISRLINIPSLTPLALIVSVLLAGLIAGILGFFMFYGGVNDVFVGLITLCVAIAFYTFMMQTAGPKWAINGIELGGWNGLSQIPKVHIGSFKIIGIPFYFLILTCVFAVYIVLRKLLTSKLGYSLLAIRENRSRSELFGYNVPKIQTAVFAAGGCIAGLAGVLYSAWGAYISPSNISMTASTLPVVLVAAGGRKNSTAAIIFTSLYCYLSTTLASSNTGSQYSQIILGVMLILVVLIVPEGILARIFRALDDFAFKYAESRRSRRENLE